MTNAAAVHRTSLPTTKLPLPGQVRPVRAFIEAKLAPRAVADQRWSASNIHSPTQIEHGPWTDFLSAYRRVDAAGIARIAYGSVRAHDRAALSDYLGTLKSTIVTRLARAEQVAFWVNLYNAATVALVLQNYPIKSVRAIGPLLSCGPWSLGIATVEGQSLSLAHIENRILRPIWQDPRLHYVLNCASVGCPNLPPTAFTRENSEALLRDAQAEYIAGQRGVRSMAGKVFVSSIYNWFAKDFGGRHRLLVHLGEHATEAVADTLTRRKRIDGYFYDWGLNAAA